MPSINDLACKGCNGFDCGCSDPVFLGIIPPPASIIDHSHSRLPEMAGPTGAVKTEIVSLHAETTIPQGGQDHA